ncbi:EthD domain-containing protein [Nemania sp. FL0031]|nr:EthD domain-containing protein [Nemania sp. FL0031]
MPYTGLVFASRKPGTTPEQFKTHYENSHIPLLRGIAGAAFPLSHTRRYLHRSDIKSVANTVRNPDSPATVILGKQDDFDYDVVAELTFEDEAAFKTYFGLMRQPENAAKITADEDKFLDKTELRAVILGDTIVTRRGEDNK